MSIHDLIDRTKFIGPDLHARTCIIKDLIEEFIMQYGELPRRLQVREGILLGRMFRIGHPITWMDVHQLGLISTRNATYNLKILAAKKYVRKITCETPEYSLYELTLEKGVSVGKRIDTILQYIEDNIKNTSLEEFKRAREFLTMTAHNPLTKYYEEERYENFA